ncbi:T9SS type A sorting domain-containing protein [Psychroflexus planctonicus]|uniref:Secretion system C-terminal sorting domain-containing protein n=1 Tax=Psychroflexus planctonicus TaxID=1526575 RepID=A0ABQ1SB23_9FLAO|nr:T9SS type A sorting domain-containing protein [Psychroflexus planctonicus]GGE24126.1 hypothetical protein GCM10010832_01040 [Psychroflexus planctonicus]
MKTIIKTAIFVFFITANAQVDPILDHTWTIEKIVTEDGTIIADLNAFGEYDQLDFSDEFSSDGITFFYYFLPDCESNVVFLENEQSFYNEILGCTLNSDSSDIGDYYNGVFIQGSEVVTFDNEVMSNAYGPFNYDFRYEGDLIYLDITNTNGEVATFWASTLSNDDFDRTNFSLYPNPVANELYVESELAKIELIEIYSLNGKQVLKVDFQKNNPIDVSNLAKGLYLVKAQTENKILTKKLIKE